MGMCRYSEKDFFKGWERVLRRYSNRWNIYGIDLRNEGHGDASWGSNDVGTDYALFYERSIKYINARVPSYKGLFFAQGVEKNVEVEYPSGYPAWYGGNLDGVKEYPLDLGMAALNTRIAYTPHGYGPPVYEQNYFADEEFPDNLPKIWGTQFAFIEEDIGNAVVFGQWGGPLEDELDITTQTSFANWMKYNCMEDNYWWALNVNEDMGGIMLEGWEDFNQPAIDLLDIVQPYPTFMEMKNDQVCVKFGRAALPRCETNTKTINSRILGKGADTKIPIAVYDLPMGLASEGLYKGIPMVDNSIKATTTPKATTKPKATQTPKATPKATQTPKATTKPKATQTPKANSVPKPANNKNVRGASGAGNKNMKNPNMYTSPQPNYVVGKPKAETDTSNDPLQKYAVQCYGCGGKLSILNTDEWYMPVLNEPQRYIRMDFEVYNSSPRKVCDVQVYITEFEDLLLDPNARFYEAELGAQYDTLGMPKELNALDPGQDFDAGFVLPFDEGFPTIELIAMNLC